MIEFEQVIYLDVQKTGSCFIRDFFRANVASRELFSKQHVPVKTRREDVLYVISCRDPLRQYLSLYSFGCSRGGFFHNAMTRAGQGDVYNGTEDGFVRWLSLVLDGEQVLGYVEKRDQNPLLKTVGLQTLRFLTLAFPRSPKVLRSILKGADLVQSYREAGLPQACVRTEHMKTDLVELVSGKHRERFLGIKTAEMFLKYHRATNRSKKVEVDLNRLGKDTLARVQQREAFFFNVLGYPPYVQVSQRTDEKRAPDTPAPLALGVEES